MRPFLCATDCSFLFRQRILRNGASRRGSDFGLQDLKSQNRTRSLFFIRFPALSFCGLGLNRCSSEIERTKEEGTQLPPLLPRFLSVHWSKAVDPQHPANVSMHLRCWHGQPLVIEASNDFRNWTPVFITLTRPYRCLSTLTQIRECHHASTGPVTNNFQVQKIPAQI